MILGVTAAEGQGWSNWGKLKNEQTARYVESGSTGPNANPAAPVKRAKQLAAAEVQGITVQSVLVGTGGWNPTNPWCGAGRFLEGCQIASVG